MSEPYEGLFTGWHAAVRVAHNVASRTGRRHEVRHMANVHPEWSSFWPGDNWVVREVGQ
jgi:hypothetical protein